ncbi:germ cell nuclear acidic protein [Macrotis lagotis]|uniref:germ cell nuclear acidic protein n=1 Tax=Macrotis lagotis TaxID=92651 RepID=UPI003D68829F
MAEALGEAAVLHGWLPKLQGAAAAQPPGRGQLLPAPARACRGRLLPAWPGPCRLFPAPCSARPGAASPRPRSGPPDSASPRPRSGRGGFSSLPARPGPGAASPRPRSGPAGFGFSPPPLEPAGFGFSPPPLGPAGGFSPLPLGPARFGFSPPPLGPAGGGFSPPPLGPAGSGFSLLRPAGGGLSRSGLPCRCRFEERVPGEAPPPCACAVRGDGPLSRGLYGIGAGPSARFAETAVVAFSRLKAPEEGPGQRSIPESLGSCSFARRRRRHRKGLGLQVSDMETEEKHEENNQQASRPAAFESSSDEEFEMVLSKIKILKISSCWEKRNDQWDEAASSVDESVKGKKSREKSKEKNSFKTPSGDVSSSVQDSGTPTLGFSGISGTVPTLLTPPVITARNPSAPKSSQRMKTCAMDGCFLAELSDPTSDYVKDFHQKKEELTWKLYHLFNATIFGKQLPEKMSINWNKKMRTTAGYCHFSGKECITHTRSVRIELSEKVCDSADRLRDTLIHELCHGATWLFHGVRDCHGPFWKIYAQRSSSVHPELPVVKRCHTYEIHYKFVYECTKCKARLGRHSKSVDTGRMVCSLCRGSLHLLPPNQSTSTAESTLRTTAIDQTKRPRQPARRRKRANLSHQEVPLKKKRKSQKS